LSVLSDNSLSFEGSAGQLFSISNNLSSGTIFSINDISGLPVFRTQADGTVSMGEYSGRVGVGLSTPLYKLHVSGTFGVTGISSFLNNTNSTSSTSGAVIITGGLGVSGNVRIGTGLGVSGAAIFGSTVTFSAPLATSSGGTGLSQIGIANSLLGVNSGASALEYKSVLAGTGITLSNATGSLTITAYFK